MKIHIGADHAGYDLKQKLIPHLESLGHEVVDEGAHSMDPDDDYPDFIIPVAEAVSNDPEGTRGVVIGGSGQGEAIAANKFPNVRAMVFYGSVGTHQDIDINGSKSDDPFEMLSLSREHNNSNVLSLGSRFITEYEAEEATKLWLESEFKGAKRHVRRLKKIDDALEKSCGSLAPGD